METEMRVTSVYVLLSLLLVSCTPQLEESLCFFVVFSWHGNMSPGLVGRCQKPTLMA